MPFVGRTLSDRLAKQPPDAIFQMRVQRTRPLHLRQQEPLEIARNAGRSVERPVAFGQYACKRTAFACRFSTGHENDRTHVDLRSLPRRHRRGRLRGAGQERDGGGVFPGQADQRDHRLQSRRSLRRLFAPRRDAAAEIHPRQSQDRAAEHAGRRQRQGGELPLQPGAARWADDRRHRPAASGQPGAGRRQRQVRHAPVQLARPLHLRRRGDGDLAHLAGQIARRCHETRDARWPRPARARRRTRSRC